MRVGSFAVARPAWYDRNPTEVSNSFTGSNGGFTNGNQFSYTVASGKLLYLDAMFAGIWCSVVATGNGTDQAAMIFTPSGGSATSLLDARLYIESAGATATQVFGGSVLIFPGGVIQGYAFNGQTGGTTAYELTYHGVLFDK